MRPRRGALGLRGRIVGAVIVTTVASLVVAALALLGPLEHNLRNAEKTTFKNQVSTATAAFTSPPPDLSLLRYYALVPRPLPRRSNEEERDARQTDLTLHKAAVVQHNRLLSAEKRLTHGRLGAIEVALWGRAASGRMVLVAQTGIDSKSAFDHSWNAAFVALHSGKGKRGPSYRTVSIDGTEYALAALPFSTRSAASAAARWVLVVRKPFVEVNDAVHAVRTAFVDAALAALALTLLLAIPLAFRIVRRLRHLREAALKLAAGGSPVEVPADRARDEVGDLARAFAVMQTQLQHQEEARRAFVATASHELRTPLTSLEGMLELLEEDLGDGQPDLDDARALLARARAQSHRLGRLAADLLDLSRLDAQVGLRSEPVELGELSRAVLAEFELGTNERSITPELHDAESPVWALGDPGSVARILRILLDNAMRVSPPGSEITVVLHGGDRAELSVSDQGPGVPDDERELIFERFHRGSSRSGQPGFGLGLAIGRELAQRMGGDLALEQSNGSGAKFTLHLPVATAPDHDPVAVG